MSEMQRLLLMAAYYEGARPGSRFHKCAPVIARALKWAGRWNEQTQDAIWGGKDNRDIEACYGVAMIRHEPENEANFQGRGNFGHKEHPAALPPYTECRLTLAGARLAEELLEQYPDLRE